MRASCELAQTFLDYSCALRSWALCTRLVPCLSYDFASPGSGQDAVQGLHLSTVLQLLVAYECVYVRLGTRQQVGVALLPCSMYCSAKANLGGDRALPFVVALLQLWQEVLEWSAPYRARYRAAKNVFDGWWEVRTERCAPARF